MIKMTLQQTTQLASLAMSPCRQADDAEVEASEASEAQRMVLFQRSGLLPEDLGADGADSSLSSFSYLLISHTYHIHITYMTCSMITYLADIGLRHFNCNYYKCEYLHLFELCIPPTMSSDTCLLITMIADCCDVRCESS